MQQSSESTRKGLTKSDRAAYAETISNGGSFGQSGLNQTADRIEKHDPQGASRLRNHSEALRNESKSNGTS